MARTWTQADYDKWRRTGSVGGPDDDPTDPAMVANAGDIFPIATIEDYYNWGFGGGSPDPTKDIRQFAAENGLTLQQFQQQFGGLPFTFNADGTATYDPAARRNAYEYAGTPDWRETVFPAAIAGLGLAGLGGFLPGTESIFGGTASAGAGAATGAGEFASSFAPTITPSTVAGSTLAGSVGPSMPTVAGLSGVGGLTAEGMTALGAMGSAGAGLGAGTTGVLGSLGLDAAGNIVPSLTNLASSGSVLPTVGGTASIPTTTGVPSGSSATTAATTASTAKSKLAELLNIDQGTADLIGKGLSAALGLYGANQQADASKDLFNQYMSMGAPFRAELNALNANPSSFYSSPVFQGALQQGSDSLARSLSAKVGNPILNPTALQEMQNYTTRGSLDAFNQRWNQLASAGQLGVSQAGSLGAMANDAKGNTYNALGAGLASVFGNQRDYAGELLDLMRSRQSGGGFSLA